MTSPIMYGVWIPKQGWLRTTNGAVAFENKEVADETAKRCGQGAKVYYVDMALIDLEQNFLSLEKSEVKGLRNMFSFWMQRIKVK